MSGEGLPVTLHLSRKLPCDSTRRSPLSPVTSGAEAGEEEEEEAEERRKEKKKRERKVHS